MNTPTWNALPAEMKYAVVAHLAANDTAAFSNSCREAYALSIPRLYRVSESCDRLWIMLTADFLFFRKCASRAARLCIHSCAPCPSPIATTFECSLSI